MMTAWRCHSSIPTKINHGCNLIELKVLASTKDALRQATDPSSNRLVLLGRKVAVSVRRTFHYKVVDNQGPHMAITLIRVGCTRPQQTVSQEIALHTQTSYTTPGTKSDKQPTARLMPHIPRGGPEALEGGGSLTGTPWWWGATKHPSCTTGSIHNLQKGHKYPTSRPCQATRTIRHINASTQHRRTPRHSIQYCFPPQAQGQGGCGTTLTAGCCLGGGCWKGLGRTLRCHRHR